MQWKSRKSLSLTEYTVAIICPLEVEMSAVRYMLDEEHTRLTNVEGDRNSYVYGKLSGHNVVIGFLPHGSQGVGAAATVATNMRRSFPSITLRLLVGIAGGIPSRVDDIRLGDVVVSMPSNTSGGVVQYDLGRETISGFERKGNLEPPPREWRDAVVLMMSDHRVHGNQVDKYTSEMLERYPRLNTFHRPRSCEDRLFVASSNHPLGNTTCKNCDTSQLVQRHDRDVDGSLIFFGIIASGDRVIKNGILRDDISRQSGGALCVEMEAAGLMNDFHCIVIRGICDYADSHKNDSWHSYSSAAAAACAKELLTYVEPVATAQTLVQTSKFLITPKQHVDDFVGREEDLAKMNAYFTRSGSDRPRIFTIHALGGQGKTQLVLEYCHRFRDTYDGIFWINATSESSITHCFASISGQLDVEGSVTAASPAAKVKFVLWTLAHWSARWLMIFDGCDESEAFGSMRKFLPEEGRADVLLTCRHLEFDHLGPVHVLLPLEASFGAELLLSGFQDSSVMNYTKDAIEIVKRLGGLPIAIKQVAGYFQEAGLPIQRLSGFNNTYESDRAAILEYVSEEMFKYSAFHLDETERKYTIRTSTTWERSLAQLSDHDLLQHEAMVHVLELSSIFSPSSIEDALFRIYFEATSNAPEWMHLFADHVPPEVSNSSLFSSRPPILQHQQSGLDHPGSSSPSDATTLVNQSPRLVQSEPNLSQGAWKWSREKFQAFVDLTRRMSLTQPVSATPQHGMVAFSLHPLIRDWLQLRQAPSARRTYAKEAFHIVAACIRAVEKADEETFARAKHLLVPHMNAITQFQDQYEEPGNRVVDDVANEPQIYTWANFYFNQKMDEQSLKFYERAYKTIRAAKGPSDKLSLRYGRYVAWVQYFCQRHAEAAELMEYVLSAQLKNGSMLAEYQETMTKLECILAGWISDMDWDCPTAESMLKDTLESHISSIDKTSASAITVARHMRAVQTYLGRERKIEAMYRLMIELNRTQLGESHIRTLDAYGTLSFFLSRTGRGQEAESLAREVLRIKRTKSKSQGKGLGKGLAHLADALWAQGRLEEAEQMMKRSILDSEEHYGIDSKRTTFYRYCLSIVLRDQGRHDEALRLEKDVCAKAFEFLGLQKRPTKRYATRLLMNLRDQGADEAASTAILKEIADNCNISQNEWQTFLEEVLSGRLKFKT